MNSQCPACGQTLTHVLVVKDGKVAQLDVCITHGVIGQAIRPRETHED